MSNATSSPPDLDAFCGLDALGIRATGQRVEIDRAVLDCRVLEAGACCHRCSRAGEPRATVNRTIVYVPLGWRPTMRQVGVRRYRCVACCTVWRHGTSTAAAART